MKFATLRNGTRDGALVIVSRDLKRCVKAPRIASTLRMALDDWERRLSPLLDTSGAPIVQFEEKRETTMV